jgi:toxin ParE1/3/4
MPKVVERPKARRELEDIAVHISRHRPSAARGFLITVRKLYDALAAMPAMGSPWEPENQRFADIRFFTIPRYPNYVIFYRPVRGGVEILHVLHGARDLSTVLGADEL